MCSSLMTEVIGVFFTFNKLSPKGFTWNKLPLQGNLEMGEGEGGEIKRKDIPKYLSYTQWFMEYVCMFYQFDLSRLEECRNLTKSPSELATQWAWT